jgi:hypothetical protein
VAADGGHSGGIWSGFGDGNESLYLFLLCFDFDLVVSFGLAFGSVFRIG